MTTYYVDTAVGNDSNAGTSEGAGNAWATIQKAMNTVADDDVVYVKASGTYTEDITFVTSGGLVGGNRGILFEGYTSTPGDGGQVTTAASAAAYNWTSSGGLGAINTIRNFNIGSGSTGSISISAAGQNWQNCTFTGNVNITGNGCGFKCTVTGATGDGISCANYVTAVGCHIISPAQHGIDAGSNNALTGINCLIETPTSSGLIGGDGSVFFGNTIVGNEGTPPGSTYGTYTGAEYAAVVANNIIDRFNFGYWSSDSLYIVNAACVGYNLITDIQTSPSGAPYAKACYAFAYGDSSETSDPGFTDQANDGFTLTTDSAGYTTGVEP